MLAYIGAGSNLGDREEWLQKGLTRLQKTRSVSLSRTSPVYETDPVGFSDQGRFLNAVWEIETDLSPRQLLDELMTIERELGRQRTFRNGPRNIDLDLLAYDDRVETTPELVIPHPRLHERAFVLKPLVDLNPDWVHPALHRTARDLLNNLLPVP